MDKANQTVCIKRIFVFNLRKAYKLTINTKNNVILLFQVKEMMTKEM